MTEPTQLIEVAKGEDKSIPLVFEDPDGDVVDISSAAEILLVVKESALEATSAEISLSFTGGEITFDTDGTDGLATALFAEAETDLLSEDSADWVFDVWLELNGAKEQVVRVGRFRLLPRVGDP